MRKFLGSGMVEDGRLAMGCFLGHQRIHTMGKVRCG